MNGEINVVALVRCEEQYIFMFDEANRTETLRMLGRCAADPGLSFTWFDAAVLSQKVREMMPAKSTMPAPVSNMRSKQEVRPKRDRVPRSPRPHLVFSCRRNLTFRTSF